MKKESKVIKVPRKSGVRRCELCSQFLPAPLDSSRLCHPSPAFDSPGGTVFNVILEVWLRQGERAQ